MASGREGEGEERGYAVVMNEWKDNRLVTSFSDGTLSLLGNNLQVF